MEKNIPPHVRERVLKALDGLPAGAVENHITRLDPEYFETFAPEEIRRHIETIQTLSTERLCSLQIVPGKGEVFVITVVGLDFTGLFAILTGLLTLAGFNIRTGDIFTYSRHQKTADPAPQENAYLLQRKKIIDRIEALHKNPASVGPDAAEALERELNRLLLLLQQNRPEAMRAELSRRIGQHLARLSETRATKLFPVEIELDPDESFTRLHIRGEDTPAFLFSLSNALSLQGISIHKVFINTRHDSVDDTLFIADKYERPITDPDHLNRLKAAIVLIKQFTLLLPLATDAELAMKQFDQFVHEAIFQSESPVNFLDLNDQALLSSLAQILGAGKYLWEEFVRMQYRSLLPMLRSQDELRDRKTRAQHETALRRIVEQETSPETRIDAINAYKNRELFRTDLLYLVYPGRSFLDFSHDLTELAESIIHITVELLFDDLVRQYGSPRTEDGKSCGYCVLALGKLGARELGYASDIEIVLIYESPGWTSSSANSTSNAEFFNALVERMKRSIRAKQDGIFEIDLRLRPDGNKGQLACSLPRWIEYYSLAGNAYDYERQALVKLRPVCGSDDLGRRIMEERDKILYGPTPVGIENTLELRRKQIATLVKHGTRNAKFSEGGLTDLEYTVQFLQMRHGHTHPTLREPNTARALEKLLDRELISPTAFEKLTNAYAFLRRLINALRMVNGNARDLVIPETESDAFRFLARRLGYIQRGDHSPEAQLQRDIHYIFKAAHAYFERMFVSKDAAPDPDPGLPELLLGKLTPEQEAAVVAELNIGEASVVLPTLHSLSRITEGDRTLAAVMVMAKRHIAASPSPEKVIFHLEKFLINCQDKHTLLKALLFDPRQIEWLVLVFAYSDVLSEILIGDPRLMEYIGNEAALFSGKALEQYQEELGALTGGEQNLDRVMETVRGYRDRETLRIGLRDIYLSIDLPQVVREISDLSEALFGAAYGAVFRHIGRPELADRQTVIVQGKMGGRELNYSSDIDIVFVSQGLDDADRALLERADNELIARLTTATRNGGKLFRVDTRLRPYGAAGPMVGTVDAYLAYYRDKADGWELQAWIKARALAGNRTLGRSLVGAVQSLIFSQNNKRRIAQSMARLRGKILAQLRRENTERTHVKLGPGGIRPIEFATQELQVRFGDFFPDIVTGHTLNALAKLLEHGLLAPADHELLTRAYRFLRKIEHRLQLFGFQQAHLLPDNELELTKLAKRMGFENRIEETALAQFLKEYDLLTAQVEKTTAGIFSAEEVDLPR